ncbi:MAG: hypothetical protein ACYDGW_08880 [Vulcanimicrobiaceae bacterium]
MPVAPWQLEQFVLKTLAPRAAETPPVDATVVDVAAETGAALVAAIGEAAGPAVLEALEL